MQVIFPVMKGLFMAVKQMIIGSFSQAFKKNFYNELVIGKLAHTEFKDNVKKGDDKITLYGNKKHDTKHNEYVCYNEKCPNYNKIIDRDKNAMLNLLALAEHPELNTTL